MPTTKEQNDELKMLVKIENLCFSIKDKSIVIQKKKANGSLALNDLNTFHEYLLDYVADITSVVKKLRTMSVNRAVLQNKMTRLAKKLENGDISKEDEEEMSKLPQLSTPKWRVKECIKKRQVSSCKDCLRFSDCDLLEEYKEFIKNEK